MKKFLLASLGFSLLGAGAYAQTERVVLFESFSGENCPPCAGVNPGIRTLLNTGENDEKILMVKYQTPIPSAGPIYYQNTVDIGARVSYYSVSSAPTVYLDGKKSPDASGSSTGGDAGHPAFILNNPALLNPFKTAAPGFSIEIQDYTITGSTISANVKVTAIGALSLPQLKLRAALVETLDFATAPGTNGESHFTNTVRKMYPNAAGQDMNDTWTSGATQTLTVTGAVPDYVNQDNEHFLVVWIQDDADKSIKQAARNIYAKEAKVKDLKLSATENLTCTTPYSLVGKTTVKNVGTTAITSFKVYYKEANAASWSTYDWTGSLASKGQVEVTLPSVSVTGNGYIGLVDSIGMINGEVNYKFAPNLVAQSEGVLKLNSTTPNALPIENGFEAASGEFYPYSTPNNGIISIVSAPGKGKDGSNNMLYFSGYNYRAGVTGFLILPYADLSAAGPKALDFYVAHASYPDPAVGNEKLEVVYTTNCGDSWTSIYSKEGADLQTVSPTTALYIPNGEAHWKKHSVDMTSVPNGAQIAFKATSGYGNNLFIDNVKLRNGLGIEDIIVDNSFKVYPNPVKEELNLEFTTINNEEVKISIVNILGQTVIQNDYQQTSKGNNVIKINTNALANGVYFVNISTESGNKSIKFVK